MTWLVLERMTAGAHSIAAHQPLSAAHELMRQHDIRHLPVLRGGKLVGLVSQRDLHLVETLRDVDPKAVPVDEAMTHDVFTTSPHAPLGHVAREMAQRKLGSAVVVDGGRVVGVLTTVDALHALADLLDEAH